MIYPLIMAPVFKEIVWGGENLKKVYGKDIPSANTAESWEIASHKNGVSSVSNGVFAGKPFDGVIASMGRDLLGANISPDEKFPLLFKVLDANDKLSVQVHPDDEYAFTNAGGEKGKTEMWYVLRAEQGAQLVYGFKQGVTKESYLQAMEDGTLEDIMNYVDVAEGDVFFIPAGTVHAIGKGIMIAEMQQNSDTTYRLYDYNRKDKKTGALRELHKKEAYDVSDINPATGSEKTEGFTYSDGSSKITVYVICDFFAFEKMEISEGISLETKNKMQALFCAWGNGDIVYAHGERESFKTGDTVVIPAALGSYEIKGNCTVLKSWVPDKEEEAKRLTEKGYDISLNKISGI